VTTSDPAHRIGTLATNRREATTRDPAGLRRIERGVARHPGGSLGGRRLGLPTSCSWPARTSNAAGSASFANKWLRRSTHRSVRELTSSIRTWITNWNDDPKPFVWHKTTGRSPRRTRCRENPPYQQGSLALPRDRSWLGAQGTRPHGLQEPRHCRRAPGLGRLGAGSDRPRPDPPNTRAHRRDQRARQGAR
jgi:hypothetical protein